MAALNDVHTAIQSLVAATWPDIVVHGVYEVETLNSIPWDDLKPPYAAIMASEPVGTDDFGLQCYWFNVPCKVFFAQEVGEEGQREALRQRIEDFALALEATDLDCGQLLHTDRLDTSDTSEVNRVFAGKDYAHRAGVVEFTVLLYIGPPL